VDQADGERDERLDLVVVIGDRPGGQACRQLELILEALAAAGYGVGLLLLRDRAAPPDAGALTRLRPLLERGLAAWLDPERAIETALALVLTPSFGDFTRNRPLHLRAGQSLLWPADPLDCSPAATPDELARRLQAIEAALGGPACLAARTPAELRLLARLAPGCPLSSAVWWPLMPLRADLPPPGVPALRVGRHWHGGGALPETALAELDHALGDLDGLEVAFWGHAERLSELGDLGEAANVSVVDGARQPPKAFLAGLGAFLALGEPAAGTRLPIEILEALAADLLVIGSPQALEGLDGDFPSAEPGQIGGLARRLLADHAGHGQALARQRRFLAERAGSAAFQARIARLIGPPSRARPLLWPARFRRERKVLLISDEGRAGEHLARQVALARALPATLRPYHLTLSRDAALAESAGQPVEYLLPHTSAAYRERLGENTEWNHWFARHLNELITFLDARAILFDGTFPFAGLVEAMQHHAARPFVWVRRGLWQPGADPAALARSSLFDLVVEPGDLAAGLDRGPTRALRPQALQLPPIRLDPVPVAGAGGGDAAPPVIWLAPTLAREAEGQALPILLRTLIEADALLVADHEDVRSRAAGWQIEVAPAAQPTVDAAIGAADYRTFHQLAALGLPMVLMPDASRAHDDQPGRAAHAEREGWAIQLRSDDVYGARSAAATLLEPASRQRMRRALEQEPREDGAGLLAFAVEQLVYGLDLDAAADIRLRAVSRR
jgi:hypothetical protein